MRQILWLSIIPLTAFWLYSVDIYSLSAAFIPAVLSILLGLAISTLGFSGTEVIMPKRLAVAAIPFAVSCLAIPYPYNIGLAITSIGLILALLLPKMNALWLGTIFSGVVLIVHTLILSLYYIMATSTHDIGWVSPLVSLLSDITGLEAASSNNMLFINSLGQTFPFTFTLEKLGFYPWILIFAGASVLVYLTSQNNIWALKRIISIFLISTLYLFFRFIVLLHIFFATDMPENTFNRISIFFEPVWLLISFVPLTLLFLFIYNLTGFKFDFSLNMNKRFAIGLMAISVSIFCLVGAVIFQDPGIEKNGRILVDEIHSPWEFSTLELDRSWYGDNSTYNAYSMVEWLKEIYHVDRVVGPSYKDWNVPGATKVVPDKVSDKLNYDLLKNYDILIIKTPSHYQPDEIEAIVQFVKNGGGLLLIGDHTNFAGTSTNLNQISRRFGIEFGFDHVNTQEGVLYHYNRSIIPYICTRYMPYLDFMTGCSINAPINAEPAILGFGLSAIPGEYASTGFFRETRSDDPTQFTDTTWGLINQAVALSYGNGRVIAFADSTIISNFRIFFGGSPNLILGCVEYLNHRNRYEYIKLILLLIGLLIGGLGAYLLVRGTESSNKKIAALVLILALGSISSAGALLSFSIDVKDTIPSQFYVKNNTICFDGEHSAEIVGLGDKLGDYETFFIWTQRMGLTPSFENTLKEAFGKGGVLVIINPPENFSEEEIKPILNYVREGNSVLLLVDAKGCGSRLMQSFGLDTYTIDQPSKEKNNNSQEYHELPIEPWGLTIKGGKRLASMGDRVIFAEITYGKGKFLLFTDADVFKNGFVGDPGYMGYSNSDPKSMNDLGYNLTALYDLEYTLFENALSD